MQVAIVVSTLLTLWCGRPGLTSRIAIAIKAIKAINSISGTTGGELNSGGLHQDRTKHGSANISATSSIGHVTRCMCDLRPFATHTSFHSEICVRDNYSECFGSFCRLPDTKGYWYTLINN
ncbi:hypothetical protein PspLS_09319 [Pyricularia sp. CBS 133598]|nr:hypothetical protein PspLS_09319 [Pyricularia sp. CBS 133598]